jgi:hypothetical protein
MVADITIGLVEFATEAARSFSPVMESLCCGSGTIKVCQELDGVLKAIWFALEERCPPKPSP